MNLLWNLSPPPPPPRPWQPWPRSGWSDRSKHSWSQNSPSRQGHIATETSCWCHFHFSQTCVIWRLFAFSVTWHRHQELHPGRSWGFHSLRGRQVYFHTATAAAAAENYLKRVHRKSEREELLSLRVRQVYLHTDVYTTYTIRTYLHTNAYTYILTSGSSTNYLKKIRNSAYSDWGLAKDFSGNLIWC